MVIVKGNPTVTAHFAVQVRSKAVLAVGIKENGGENSRPGDSLPSASRCLFCDLTVARPCTCGSKRCQGRWIS